RPAWPDLVEDRGRWDRAVGDDEGVTCRPGGHLDRGPSIAWSIAGLPVRDARWRSTQAATDGASSIAPAARRSSGSPTADSIPIGRAPTATAICMSVGASPTYIEVSGRCSSAARRRGCPWGTVWG